MSTEDKALEDILKECHHWFIPVWFNKSVCCKCYKQKEILND
jgi:hypothetical protein